MWQWSVSSSAQLGMSHQNTPVMLFVWSFPTSSRVLNTRDLAMRWENWRVAAGG